MPSGGYIGEVILLFPLYYYQARRSLTSVTEFVSENVRAARSYYNSFRMSRVAVLRKRVERVRTRLFLPRHTRSHTLTLDFGICDSEGITHLSSESVQIL